jgi:3-hydroxybutyryl-CoA dehydrogenase
MTHKAMSSGQPLAPDTAPAIEPLGGIAIIGAGHAGRQFALRCAMAGFDVVLEDVMPANLRRAEAEFAELAPGLDGAMGDKQGRLRFALTVEDAVREAGLAIDFVPDELESKLEIFCLIDRMAPPRTILCTPSDTLSITDLASCTYRGERCFAVRGELMGEGHASPASPSALRLLVPRDANPTATAQLQAFFVALGRQVMVEADSDAPMLVKNTHLLER